MLKKETNVNIEDNDRRTPLFYAFPANIDFDINCQGAPSHKTYLLIIRELLKKEAIYVNNIDQ